MDALSRWDIALLVISGYMAVLALVRLMARYREELVADVRRQMEAEQARRKAAQKPAAPLRGAPSSRRTA